VGGVCLSPNYVFIHRGRNAQESFLFVCVRERVCVCLSVGPFSCPAPLFTTYTQTKSKGVLSLCVCGCVSVCLSICICCSAVALVAVLLRLLQSLTPTMYTYIGQMQRNSFRFACSFWDKRHRIENQIIRHVRGAGPR